MTREQREQREQRLKVLEGLIDNRVQYGEEWKRPQHMYFLRGYTSEYRLSVRALQRDLDEMVNRGILMRRFVRQGHFKHHVYSKLAIIELPF